MDGEGETHIRVSVNTKIMLERIRDANSLASLDDAIQSLLPRPRLSFGKSLTREELTSDSWQELEEKIKNVEWRGYPIVDAYRNMEDGKIYVRGVELIPVSLVLKNSTSKYEEDEKTGA